MGQQSFDTSYTILPLKIKGLRIRRGTLYLYSSTLS